MYLKQKKSIMSEISKLSNGVEKKKSCSDDACSFKICRNFGNNLIGLTTWNYWKGINYTLITLNKPPPPNTCYITKAIPIKFPLSM